MRTLPTGADVEDFLAGQDPDQHLSTITALARGYTRGNGFYPGGMVADDLGAVIVTAAARLLANPEQNESEVVGPISTRGGFKGWTLAELAVLNAWRGTAC